MQAWMWRLTDDHAVIYTDDKATLKALFAYSRFPHQDLSRATTYQRKNGRVFAWQFTFPVSAWNGVVRFLGRASITMLDDERWITEAKSPPLSTVVSEPVKTGKKGKPATPVAAKAPITANARPRKREAQPPIDLSEPLRPMATATSKTGTSKTRPATEPLAASSVTPPPDSVRKAFAASTPKPSYASTTTPGGDSPRRNGATKAKVQATAAVPAIADTTTLTKPGKTKPASAAAKAAPGGRAESPPVRSAVPAAPAPTPRRPAARREKLTATELLLPETVAKNEGRLSAAIDDVQRTLAQPVVRAAYSEPVSSPTTRSGRLKGASAVASTLGRVSIEPTGSSRTTPNGSGKRKAPTAEPVPATPSARASATILAPERPAPPSPTPRRRSSKSYGKQD